MKVKGREGGDFCQSFPFKLTVDMVLDVGGCSVDGIAIAYRDAIRGGEPLIG